MNKEEDAEEGEEEEEHCSHDVWVWDTRGIDIGRYTGCILRCTDIGGGPRDTGDLLTLDQVAPEEPTEAAS